MKTTNITGGTLILLAGLLCACCTVDASQATNIVPKLVIGTTNQVNDININDYYYSIFRESISHEGLIALNPDGSFAPRLAENWQSADGKTWTFNLRKNAFWHDGTPVTAQDIKFTLEYIQEKIPRFKQFWGQIDNIETPNNYTVKIDLKKPNSNFLSNLLVMTAIPQHIFKDVSDPSKYNEENATIGCGPYKYVLFDKNAGTLTFKAYDKYWGGKPAIDTIEIHFYKTEDSMIMALQKGEIDTTYMYSNGISYYYVPKLLNDNDVKISTTNSTGVTALFINTNKSVLDNTTFRRALSLAIDYDELKNLFTAGYGDSATAGFLARANYNYKDMPKLAKDINKSKELLDSIGMLDKDGDGLRETPNGKKFQPNLIARSDIANHQRLAEMIVKYFNLIGIDIKVKLVDANSFMQIANTDKSYDMLISSTSPWGMMNWCGYGSGYVDDRTSGWTRTTDPTYISIVDQMFKTTDAAEQKKLAYQMQDYYAGQLPVIALYSSDIIQPYNKKYDGWVSDPMFGILSHETFFGLHEV